MSFSTARSRPAPPLILASGSNIRRALLEDVGLSFAVRRPKVDEDALKSDFQGGDEELATALAEAKAMQVSAEFPGAIVIGGDSIAVCEGRRFDKPRDRAEASAHLRLFSGKSLDLISAVVVAQAGLPIWHHADRTSLNVRDLTDAFIAQYLDAEWPDVGQCVGVFRMEGRGATLFDEVTGSHFTVLGLPLLPLLGELRALGAMAS